MITQLSQVDRAVQNALAGLIIDGVEVPSLYINPEDVSEFKADNYPSIVFYRSGAYPDVYREITDKIYAPIFDQDGFVTSVNEKSNPTPLNVYYGIRLYYKFNEDGAYMNTFILQKFPRVSAINIDGELYDIVFVSYKNPNATYREFGVIKKNEPREFTDQYLYRVEINLEGLETPVVKKLVTEGVEVRVDLKK